eukprot:5970223-Amphidinium_carterae.2
MTQVRQAPVHTKVFIASLRMMCVENGDLTEATSFSNSFHTCLSARRHCNAKTLRSPRGEWTARPSSSTWAVKILNVLARQDSVYTSVLHHHHHRRRHHHQSSSSKVCLNSLLPGLACHAVPAAAP